jgi:TRAP-type C4-dicarboxylate transport system permease small subunit
MPKLVRLYIESVAIGFAVSAAFTGVLVWQDVMGVGHLILASPVGWLAAAMLVVFNGIVFAGVQFGLRVMLMAEGDSGPKGGLRQHDVAVPAPAAAAMGPGRAKRRKA